MNLKLRAMLSEASSKLQKRPSSPKALAVMEMLSKLAGVHHELLGHTSAQHTPAWQPLQHEFKKPTPHHLSSRAAVQQAQLTDRQH